MEQKRPAKIAFHIPSWLSSFVSLSEVAAAFLKGLKDKGKLKDFMNAYKAEPWVDYQQVRSFDRLIELRDERPKGLVPDTSKVAALTAGIDTQDNGFFYEIRAWGYGLDQESWQIRHGFVETFGALENRIFDTPYRDAAGNEHFVHLAFIDAMGHRTAEVYDWTRLYHGIVFPIKGEQRMSQPYTFTHIDHYPGTKKPIEGGVRLYRLNVTYFKNWLARKLRIDKADPGSWHYNAETTDDWVHQMCAEYLNEKGFWECPSGRANHGWDCSVYGLAAAEVLGVKFIEPEEDEEPEQEDDVRANRVPRRRWW